MNQDARKGKNFPHKAVSSYKDYTDNLIMSKCLDCGAEWIMTFAQDYDRQQGDRPIECRKDLLRDTDADATG